MNHPDLLLRADVPQAIWRRSPTPGWGVALRVYVTVSLLWTGLVAATPEIRWALLGAAALAFLAFPALIRAALRPLERRVLRASRREASALLADLRGRRVVRHLAPRGWLPLQEGRLHLICGDGKAAARALLDVSRLSRMPGPHAALLSAQAHALVLAGDRKAARAALTERAKCGTLGAREQLDLGVLLAVEPGQSGEAIELLRSAREGLGAHPWALAGLALAYERGGQGELGLEVMAEAEAAVLAAPDPFAEELLRRAQKGLRPLVKARQRRERRGERGRGEAAAVEEPRAQERAETATAGAVAAGSAGAKASGTKTSGTKASGSKTSEDPRNPPSSKKTRKQQRREARRQAKVEERGRRSAPTRPRSTAPAARALAAASAARDPGAVSQDKTQAAGSAPVAKAVNAATSAPGAQAARESESVASVSVAAGAQAARESESVASVKAPPMPPAKTPLGVHESRGAAPPPPVVLPPLLRPAAPPPSLRPAAPPPLPPLPPLRAAEPAGTPGQPRLNMPRLVSDRPALPPLPTRRAAAPAPASLVAPPLPPLPPPPISALDEGWGDLEAMERDGA